MSGRFSLSTVSLIVALVLFLAVNIASDAIFRSVRLDLTEAQLYTLSDGSRRIARDIEEPITLRLFYSEDVGRMIPSIHSYYRRVREMLEEFVEASDGKILLETIDPEPFSKEEVAAMENRISGQQVSMSGDALYFGLAGVNSTDGRKMIPYLDPSREDFLEYDITKMIYSLDHVERARVGLLTTIPVQGETDPAMRMRGGGPRAWAFYEQARELFDIETIDFSTTEIYPEIDLLIVIHPKDLPDETIFAIDQFVMRGGRLIMFLDSYAEAQPSGEADPRNPLQDMMAPKRSDIPKLLNAWGLEMVEDVVAADRDAALKVPDPASRRGEVLDHVAYLGFDDKALNKSDIVTSSLRMMNLGTSGVLRRIDASVSDNSGAEITPLIQTGENSMMIPTEEFMIYPDLRKLIAEFEPSGERLMLAARISGTLHSAFPGGPPPAIASQFTGMYREQTEEPANVVVVADVDMLSDPLWVTVREMFGQRIARPFADNGAFFVNAIEHLSGSGDLISIRGRADARREFDVIIDLQREAESRSLAKQEELMSAIEKTQTKLRELASADTSGSGILILTPEQREEFQSLEREQAELEMQLREVQYDLNKEIEQLEARVKMVNIGAIPLLVTLVAIGLGIAQIRRRRRR